MDTARSRNGVPIRLPTERWLHITEEHSEMAGRFFEVLEAIEEADTVYAGNAGECLAVKEDQPGKYLVVVYREISADDGFVITAFLTRRRQQIERRELLWPR